VRGHHPAVRLRTRGRQLRHLELHVHGVASVDGRLAVGEGGGGAAISALDHDQQQPPIHRGAPLGETERGGARWRRCPRAAWGAHLGAEGVHAEHGDREALGAAPSL
jgi:hypothetical protein